MEKEKKIEIGDKEYTIKIVAPDDDNLLMDDEEYHCGVTDFHKKIIYIKNDIKNPYTLKYTILHELVHAYTDCYGFLQVDWNNEVVADFIANNITNIIENHNKIIKWLMEVIEND